MGCNCNQTKSGATLVWQWHAPDGVKTYATDAEAQAARTRAGGKGPIIRTTQQSKG